MFLTVEVLKLGADPGSQVRGAISVIFCSQVS